jgi:hypothetical protein
MSRLTLRKDTLTALTPEELGSVVGGRRHDAHRRLPDPPLPRLPQRSAELHGLKGPLVKLTLSKDTLAELTPAELAAVAGGVITTGYYLTLPVQNCLRELTTTGAP